MDGCWAGWMSVQQRERVVLFCIGPGLALVSSMPTAAQRITGTLRGQVLDPSGAAVPDAQVTATNQETGVSVKVTTTSAGTCSFPRLIPGTYKVKVKTKSFKNFLKSEDGV